MNENEISKVIVESAIEVHRELGGPGLLESVYEEAMVDELKRRGMIVERQLAVPIFYKGKQLASPLRLDLKINGLVLIDNKAVTEWNKIFEAQMLTYLRLTSLKLGLVIFRRTIRKGRNPPNSQRSLIMKDSLRLCILASLR
jgi:GxxExxY protein